MRAANLRNMLVACVFLSVIVCPAVGKIIYVNDDATGANNGTSWTDAYTDLQSALATSISSDQIWVAAGTYKPGPIRSHSFQMKNGVGIYGGFAGNEDPNLFDPADRDFTTNETILSGDIGVVGYNADNSYHVIYNPQGTTLDSSAILDGFTISGGNVSGGPSGFGGGMFNYGASIYPCSPTVINCNFRDNFAGFGGGMGNFYYSSPTVINCVFYNNTTIPGGTLGGGMYNGMYSEPIVTNCTFSGNSAVNGGGIYSEGLSSPVVTNCILWADSALNSGDEIYHTPDSIPVVTYCNVQAGTGQIWFGVGCIDDDPCIADAATDDFHLLFNSPCINAGNNSAPNLPPTDFEGDSRIVDGVVDIGADEVLLNILVCLADPPAGGSFTLDPDGGYYESDTVVTVTANPAAGYVFDYWSGDLAGSANPNTIVMDNNKTITAHFNFTGIIYVNDDANGANNGDSWANAFTDLQDALQVANAGLEIRVAAGTYKPTMGTDPTASFQMKNGVGIYGGFAGDEDPNVFDLADRDFTTNESILSGDIGVVGNNADNCYRVIYNQQGTTLDSSAVLDGFTITGGNANGPSFLDSAGGGMLNYDNSSPTVTNCTFTSNTASENGGGMYNDNYSSPTLTNCTFRDNLARFGGGMGNYNNSSPTVTNCTFSGNSANYSGGGMDNHNNSTPTVTNCTFSGNSTSSAGGGMYNYHSSPTFSNCTFSGNSAYYYGGGMHNYYYSSPTVTNCTFSGNTANYGGGGMVNSTDSSPTVTNCILWGDLPDEIYNENASPTVTYSDVQGGWPDANNTNIDADPYFVDPNNPDPNLVSFRLKPDSPCIDAADITALLSLPLITDLDGKDRYVDILAIPNTGSGPLEFLDMGAYEFICNYTAGDSNCDGVVDFKDLAIICANWLAGTEP